MGSIPFLFQILCFTLPAEGVVPFQADGRRLFQPGTRPFFVSLPYGNDKTPKQV